LLIIDIRTPFGKDNFSNFLGRLSKWGKLRLFLESKKFFNLINIRLNIRQIPRGGNGKLLEDENRAWYSNTCFAQQGLLRFRQIVTSMNPRTTQLFPKEKYMNKNLVQQVSASQIRHDLPDFVTGDTIRVMVTIREGNKERQQAFEGVVVTVSGSGAGKTFIVRKDSAGVGVERNFLINSPIIASIEVLKHGKVRRHKLYFLRSRAGKSARLDEVIRKDKIAANLAATKTNADKKKAGEREKAKEAKEAKAAREAAEAAKAPAAKPADAPKAAEAPKAEAPKTEAK
jgi:large subunit ribosomal protein L19